MRLRRAYGSKQNVLYNDFVKEHMIKLRAGGYSYKDVSKAFNCSSSTAFYILNPIKYEQHLETCKVYRIKKEG